MTILTRRAPLAWSLLFALLITFSVQLPAQLLSNPPRSDAKIQMASLRPRLVWQRTSPKPGSAVEGPILYQLLFSTAGTPGTLAKFDTNPRHLTNSLITESGSMVAIGAFSVDSSGLVTFKSGQPFAGNGSGLTSLSGAQVTGTVANAANAANAALLNGVSTYARTDQGNTFITGTQAIQTGAAGTVGLTVQGASAQTANLQEWRNNAGTAVASVSASGLFSGNGSGLSNLSGSQLVDGGINREQIALLKWYPAFQSASFAVGTGPTGVAFDGASIWVANFNSNNVSKLRASDGTPLGTFAVGSSPQGVAFDGANIWVANEGSNTVSKLRASDGVLQGGPFTVGSFPWGVAFDGANIWVTNFSSNNVFKLRASDGVLQGGPFGIGAGNSPTGVAFDGANIWVANEGSNNVSKLRASDGAWLGTFAVGTGPQGVAFDGANIWVVNTLSNNVSKLRASDGTAQPGSPFGIGAGNSSPIKVAFDGANIWVANAGSNNVSKLRASDGFVLGTFAVGSFPIGVAFDGANIWVANNGSNTVSKL